MSQSNQQVNVVNPSCETCGGPHHYSDYQAVGGFTQGEVYAATGNYNTRDDKGKGKEAEHDHLKVNKDDKGKGKGKVHDIQNKLGNLEVDLAKAIKAKQVDDHDLDTLDLENRIKKLEEDFGGKKEDLKANEAKEAKKEKEAELKAKKAKAVELKAKKAKNAKEAMLAEVVQISSDEDPTASTSTRS
ncbi:hypothetical protein Tco_1364918 [Tanacetum coccineum]